ncbi:MAG TPA: Abi-alpha family protein [Pseudonocardia sp.]|nr:Abi-alpha family protein [Pseudonocardia sp.]
MPGDSIDPEPQSGMFASWGAVLRDMRSLAADLTKAGTETARQVPLALPHSLPSSLLPSMTQLDELWSARAKVEEAILRELRDRLALVDASGGRSDEKGSPATLLDQLLEASIDMDVAASRDQLYLTLLRQLVPDEARILAALSDGTAYPLLHVQARNNGHGYLLSNLSSVGRAAGVLLPDAVSTYVLRLRALGLAEEGPADDSLSVQYDILLGEPLVRQAEQEARTNSRLGAKTVRRTLRISALGKDLWRACRPDDPEELPGRDQDVRQSVYKPAPKIVTQPGEPPRT